MITPTPRTQLHRPENALAYHNIASGVYRMPFGAIRCGEKVILRVYAAEALAASRVYLRIWADDTECFFPMHRSGVLWECTYTAPAVPQIVWYRFEIHTSSGIVYCQPGKSALSGTDSPNRNDYQSFQLTVYDPAFTVPDWAADGIMYQIFPDRFYRSNEAAIGPHTHRLHQEWDEQMDYLPDPVKGYYAADDFFGGNLKGIEEKLPYLAELGVTVLYLNPIFRAYSNHRYDTGSYEEIDPLLGSEADLRSLCSHAAEFGIRVICDGVFSHTGSDSLYFNREGTYPTCGAYNSPESPYASWYRFQHFPDEYDCWWDVWSLPEVEETDPSYLDYITGENGIVQKWLKAGISGWRLDVADELPDEFLDRLRSRVKTTDPNALVLGEVWEDASNKVSYNALRRFLLGGQLDSVMNYPLRKMVITLMTGKTNAGAFAADFTELASNYPPQVFSSCMNFLSTHDVCRITTTFGKPYNVADVPRAQQADIRLSKDERTRAIAMQKAASLLVYSLPGMPCIYYGDEAAVEGGTDPFNRAPFPWDRRDEQSLELTEWYRRLGDIRHRFSALRSGAMQIWEESGLLCIRREADGIRLLTIVNATDAELPLPVPVASPILCSTNSNEGYIAAKSSMIARY